MIFNFLLRRAKYFGIQFVMCSVRKYRGFLHFSQGCEMPVPGFFNKFNSKKGELKTKNGFLEFVIDCS